MYYITAYKPFMGRTKNGSETLIKALSELDSLKHIEFRILEVVWNEFDNFFDTIKHSKISVA